MNWKQKIIGFNVGDTVIYTSNPTNIWYVEITKVYKGTKQFDGNFTRTIERLKSKSWYLENSGKYELKRCKRIVI